MELSVYNIKGEDTGRKITLDDAIFAIEPNDHAIYLDVKQFLANQRQGTHKSKERSENLGLVPASSSARRAVAVLAVGYQLSRTRRWWSRLRAYPT